MKHLTRILFLLGLTTSIDAADVRLNGFDFKEISKVAVQHNGRIKPLETHAKAVVGKVTGRAHFKIKDSKYSGKLPEGHAVSILLSWMTEPKLWEKVPVVKVSHKPFKKKIGIDPDQGHFSFKELQNNKIFRQLHRKVHAKNEREGERAKMNRMEREVMDVASRVFMMDSVTQGFGCAMVPHPDDKMGRWLPMSVVPQHHPRAAEAGIPQLWHELGKAFRERDASSFNNKSAELRASLNTVFNDLYKNETPKYLNKIEWEVFYNGLKPFRFSAAFYFVGLVMFLISFHLGGSRLYWAAMGVMGFGIISQIYGFILRVIITERPPVSNMYESMVFMGFMVTIFAIAFELVYRSRIFVTAAGFLSVFLLVLADQLPLDAGLDPLVPVLRTNYWLTVHVLTVMSAYAALTLALGVGHINLGIYFFAPQRKKFLEKMTLFLYRTLQLGFLLMTAGTILGAWWAGEAWGRYWGWDPKETWAFICILGYGILLHGRMAGFWGPFGTAIGSVIAWSLVGMCYYGVNFVLGAGLHSYGFGDGGIQFAIGYLVLEAIIVAAAFYGRYGRKNSDTNSNQAEKGGDKELNSASDELKTV